MPQVIYEYWTVATRPAAENGLGLTIEETAAKLTDFKAVFPLLRDERGILDRWEKFVVAPVCKESQPMTHTLSLPWIGMVFRTY